MKIAYIMRGVPGSGRSAVAKEIAGDIGVVHCANDLLTEKGDHQLINAGRLKWCHAQNLKNFIHSLKKRVPIVVCDNTNPKRWQFKKYVIAAKKEGYLVKFVTMPHPKPEEASQTATHSVPPEIIQQMISGWED